LIDLHRIGCPHKGYCQPQQWSAVDQFHIGTRIQILNAPSAWYRVSGHGRDPVRHVEVLRRRPDQASTEKIYDNLDFQRAVQAYLLALPVVNQMGNREAILSVGPVNTTVPIWENLVATRRWSAVRLSAEYRMTARCRHLSAGTKAA
jgi:hypothetical protein